jgi:hypothetical protein
MGEGHEEGRGPPDGLSRIGSSQSLAPVLVDPANRGAGVLVQLTLFVAA